MVKTALINPAVRQRLLQSGHYREMPDGRLRSEHLYSDRKKIKRHPDGLPCLIAGSVDDIKPGSSDASYFHLYFPIPPYWKVWFQGVEECVRVEEPGNPPVYVMDDHRIAYYGWHEARAMGYIQDGATLVHIDRHSDDKYPRRGLVKGSDLKTHADYALNRLAALNFIMPAVDQGLIAQFWDFTVKPGQNLSLDVLGVLKGTADKTTLGKLISRHADHRKLIIDIDLDAVVPLYGESGSVFDEAAAFLAEIAKKGGAVTVATSPGYADQNLAIPLARDLARRIIG